MSVYCSTQNIGCRYSTVLLTSNVVSACTHLTHNLRVACDSLTHAQATRASVLAAQYQDSCDMPWEHKFCTI